ncbi:MAG: hypothetical protein JKY01_03360 [Pseudomonadales bacterium]|nr:hypothetical protein [Pseudomonadales bacterium]
MAPTYTAPEVLNDEQLIFQLSVTDTSGQSATDSVQVTVSNDDPPIAYAGTDQAVSEGDFVSLDGSGSSDDIAVVSYRWVQASGTTATLSDATLVNPTFTSPVIRSDEVLTFQLTVNDIGGQTSSDTVQIFIAASTPYSYSGDTKAIIDANCVDCHAPGGRKASSPMTTYAEFMLYASDAAVNIESGSMPKPPGSLSAADIAIMLDWIGGGSPEN